MNLIENNQKSIVCFHNLGRFDFTFILNWLVNNKKEAGKIDVIEIKIIIYQIEMTNHKMQFRDSLLVIPLPLKEIGKIICENNLKDNSDYDNITGLYETNPEIIRNLRVKNCLVLKEGILILNFSKLIKDRFK